MGRRNSGATFDSYVGVEVELHGRQLLLPPLTVRDGMRFLLLADLAAEGDGEAGMRLFEEFPRAVGLDPAELEVDDVARLFERCFDAEGWAPERRAEAASTGEQTPAPTLPSARWEDVLAEYTATYGPPRPRMPWPLFVAFLHRLPSFEARARLRLWESVAEAIGGAFGSEGGERRHRELRSKAYPGAETEPVDFPLIVPPSAGGET